MRNVKLSKSCDPWKMWLPIRCSYTKRLRKLGLSPVLAPVLMWTRSTSVQTENILPVQRAPATAAFLPIQERSGRSPTTVALAWSFLTLRSTERLKSHERRKITSSTDLLPLSSSTTFLLNYQPDAHLPRETSVPWWLLPYPRPASSGMRIF